MILDTRCCSSILDTIGNTPMLQFGDTFIKCEFVNPSGSVKVRFAKYVIERAETLGLIKPGDTIVEATSGNMGNALAMVAAAKGYKMLVVMPEGFSRERLVISLAYGAEVRFVGDFHLDDAVAAAIELGEQDGYFCPRQFENPLNIEENRRWLGGEILDQIPEGVVIDAFVQGVGTGGTLMGVGAALREAHNPDIKLIAMEPAESPTILTGKVGKHKIEGIADGFVPGLYQREAVYDVITVPSEEACERARRIAREHGVFVGPSSGGNLCAIDTLRERHPEIRTVLTLFCDEGEKYMSQLYPSV